MSERLSLFPMNRDLCAVARYASLLQGYELAHLFVPKYLRMGEEDVSRLDGGTPACLRLTDYSKDKLKDCDVIYMDYDEAMASIDIYKEIILHASEMGVEVIQSRMLMRMMKDESYSLYTADETPFVMSPENDILHEVNVPVVMVLSHGLQTDQLAVELALWQHFTEAGYKVGQIGSHDACRLFGINDIPDFMIEPADAYRKTIRFNKYISDLISKEKFEILIIGVPDAIVKHSNRMLQGLGVVPYAICNAVRSDVTIACTHYGNLKKTFFDEVSRYGKYRLGSPIHFFNMANTLVVPDNIMFDDITRLTYTVLESDFVLNTLNNIKAEEYYLFNVLDKNSAKEACEAVQNTLSGNASYMR